MAHLSRPNWQRRFLSIFKDKSVIIFIAVAGINENITYRGVLFHVQTEDMGPEVGLLVSNVFYSGMVIGRRETPERERLREFHEETKKMLLSGAFDERARQVVGEAFDRAPKGPTQPQPQEELSLEEVLTTKVLPALKYELGIVLPEHYITRLKERINRLEGETRKERFLKLCAEIFENVKSFCPPERFKDFVKRLYTAASIEPDEGTDTMKRSKKFFEQVTMPELEEVLGESLARALIEKVLSDLHPLFLTKPEAFNVLIEKLLNSGVIKKRTSLQWRLETKTIWQARYRSLRSEGVLII